jgi:hypothetical protein
MVQQVKPRMCELFVCCTAQQLNHPLLCLLLLLLAVAGVKLSKRLLSLLYGLHGDAVSAAVAATFYW